MKSWLRLEEAQDYCGVSKRTLRNWMKTEGLKYTKIKGTVLISIRSLDEFLERNTVSITVREEAEEILGKIL